MHAVSFEAVSKHRRAGTSSNGQRRWYTDYMGNQKPAGIEDAPQSHYTEMDANGVIVPHFHQVDQFQIFVAGTGSIGRNALPLIGLHYADRHTAYGPINAGPGGLGLFTVRAQSDPGAIYLSQPDFRTYLKPSKKRYLLAENIALSTAQVLQHRDSVALESVLDKDADPKVDFGDGLGAAMLRMGAGMQTLAPDPRSSGGQYYLVLNGSMQLSGQNYGLWSMAYAARTDAPFEIRAGADGLEALVLSFPRHD